MVLRWGGTGFGLELGECGTMVGIEQLGGEDDRGWDGREWGWDGTGWTGGGGEVLVHTYCQSRRVGRDYEASDAFVASRRVCIRHDEEYSCLYRVGDPHLLTCRVERSDQYVGLH